MANDNQANENPEENVEIKEFPHEIKLNYPVEWGKETRTIISIQRRLKAKYLKGIKANDIRMDDMIKLASRVTGEPISFIEELDAGDLMQLTEVVQSFFPSSLTTGDNR